MPKIKFTGVPNAEKRKNINLEAQLESTQEKLNKLTEFLGLKVEQIDDHQFEVIKEEVASGDFTDPIYIPIEGITTEVGKWYYVNDKDLPHEALQEAFVTQEDFDDKMWFDYI